MSGTKEESKDKIASLNNNEKKKAVTERQNAMLLKRPPRQPSKGQTTKNILPIDHEKSKAKL